MPDGRELALLTGHRVRALGLDAPGTGYAVTGPGGQRLLYLPPGGAPAGLEENSVEPYDMVLADVLGRPDALARLRRAGTPVLAVPPPRRGRRGPCTLRRSGTQLREASGWAGGRVHGADAGEFRFQFHQVVETVNHLAELFSAADDLIKGPGFGT